MAVKKVQRIYWCFTLNNPEDGELDILLSHSEKFVYQLEEGDEKTPHFQGFVKLAKRARLDTLKGYCERAHFEACKGSAMDNYVYCTKKGGALAGPWIKGYRRPVVDPLGGKELRPFQQDIMKIVDSDMEDRSIHWFWETVGNIGKSALCKHLLLTRPSEVLLLGGKAADMKYAISKFCENIENDLKIVIIDIPRTAENYISYIGIEEIKNGAFFSTKYESGQCVFNPPHVICFANFAPNTYTMSADRWNVCDLNVSCDTSHTCSAPV